MKNDGHSTIFLCTRYLPCSYSPKYWPWLVWIWGSVYKSPTPWMSTTINSWPDLKQQQISYADYIFRQQFKILIMIMCLTFINLFFILQNQPLCPNGMAHLHHHHHKISVHDKQWLLTTGDSIIFSLGSQLLYLSNVKWENAWGVMRMASERTNPEFELYFTYWPSMKCSRWNKGLPSLSIISRMAIWNISTCKKEWKTFNKHS